MEIHGKQFNVHGNGDCAYYDNVLIFSKSGPALNEHTNVQYWIDRITAEPDFCGCQFHEMMKGHCKASTPCKDVTPLVKDGGETPNVLGAEISKVKQRYENGDYDFTDVYLRFSELAEEAYGVDPNMYAAQRDGFKVGHSTTTQSFTSKLEERISVLEYERNNETNDQLKYFIQGKIDELTDLLKSIKGGITDDITFN